jgi:hypothetical protein
LINRKEGEENRSDKTSTYGERPVNTGRSPFREESKNPLRGGPSGVALASRGVRAKVTVLVAGEAWAVQRLKTQWKLAFVPPLDGVN